MDYRARERGQAGIFLTLMLSLVILGFVALAVDVGRLYVVQGELQAAADAAAQAAATRLIATANSAAEANVTGMAPFDPTNGNDNRFNLHSSSVLNSTDLASTVTLDFFATLADALAGSNGSQAGANAKYVRADISAQSPAPLTRVLSPNAGRPSVHAFAVAGISAPVCTACGVDAVAVTAVDTSDDQNFGFVPGEFYTLYLNPAQQRPNLAPCRSQVPSPLDGTLQSVEYTILNHVPTGPDTDQDGLLFRLGAGGIAPAGSADTSGCITIGAPETAMSGLQGATCPAAQPVGRDFTCGLNVRFGIDPTGNACNNISGVSDLAALFTADSDPGGASTTLEDYQQDYDGSARRVLTVAVVDDDTSLNVLNFRQFLVESDPTESGLNVGAFTGAVRAQYLGTPVPVRLGTIGGNCGVTTGVGKLVLF